MTEIVNTWIDGIVFNHIVDVEHEDEFVRKRLPALCKTQEEFEYLISSLKDDEVWPCRLQYILDVAKENGLTPIDSNFLDDNLGEYDKSTGYSYIGETGKRIHDILKKATKARVVFTSDEDDKEYELTAHGFSILKVIRDHCAGEGGSFDLRKIS